MQMDLLKKKSKMEGLQALIAQMHKAMNDGEGDKHLPVHKAISQSENELDLAGKHGMAGPAEESPEEEAGESPEQEAQEANSGDDLHKHVMEYMKRKGAAPIKGKTVVMKADMVVKKPMMGKKKYG